MMRTADRVPGAHISLLDGSFSHRQDFDLDISPNGGTKNTIRVILPHGYQPKKSRKWIRQTISVVTGAYDGLQEISLSRSPMGSWFKYITTVLQFYLYHNLLIYLLISAICISSV